MPLWSLYIILSIVYIFWISKLYKENQGVLTKMLEIRDSLWVHHIISLLYMTFSWVSTVILHNSKHSPTGNCTSDEQLW